MSDPLDAPSPDPPTEPMAAPVADPHLRSRSAAACLVKSILNWLNGSTALGLLVARAGGASIRKGARQLYLAGGYWLGFPVAGAFTVGNVVLTAGDWTQLQRDRPWLLHHEERHSWQYLWCGGLPFLPLYAGCALWSKLTTGDYYSMNYFERYAGLRIGGYQQEPLRPVFAALMPQAARRVPIS